jgi:hypothetical protein
MRAIGNHQAAEGVLSRSLGITGIALLLAGAGCDALWPTSDGLTPLIGAPVEWIDPVEIGPSSRVSGPFGQVITVPVEPGVQTSIPGTLFAPDDAVTYEIGAVSAGDRLDILVERVDVGFDPAVAVFDAGLNLLHTNDDHNYLVRDTNASVRFIARHHSDKCYVVVAPSTRSDTTGDYHLHVTLTPGDAVPQPDPQRIYLDFDGATNVVVGGRAGVTVPPFAGSMIDPQFAGDTTPLHDLIVERVRADYAAYEVEIFDSADGPPPDSAHSTVFFGSYNPTLLGLADNVDTFNTRPVQEAIVFVDTFTVFMSQEPTLIEMADALANVASHEIGHLLGLHHVTDPLAIMDTSATLRQMLRPQVFMRAPISGDTFRVGYQDAPVTLADNVGMRAGAADSLRAKWVDPVLALPAEAFDPWYEEGPRDPARAGISLSSGCTCTHGHP